MSGPLAPIPRGILRPSRRRALLAVLLAVAVVALGVGSGIYFSHFWKPKREESGVTADGASVSYSGSQTCSAVATCTFTTGIHLIAYSTLVVIVSASSVTAPSAIHDNHGGVLGTGCGTTGACAPAGSATGTNAGIWVFLQDNRTAVTGATLEKVTVNFTAATTYAMAMVDVGNVTTTALDAFGTGVSGATCTGETASVTTTATNDIVIMATAESSAKTTTATAPSTLIFTNGVGGAITQPASSTGAISSSLTYSSSVTHCEGLAFALKSSLVPSAPTSLATGAITTTTIALTWTNYKGPIVNDTIYRATYSSGACGTYSGSSAGAVQASTVSGLVSGTAYCFYVTDWNSTGQSAASNTLTNVQTANVPAAARGVTTAPIAGSTTTLLVSWTIPAKDTGLVNETVYVTSGGSCAGAPTTTSLGTGQTAFTATGLTANTQYGATVQLWNATGASVQSSCATGTTYPVPGAPTGLGVTSVWVTQIALAWTNPSGTIVNDTIDVGTVCGTWTRLVSTGGAASAFTVTGLSPYTSYCFAVGAWTSGAEGSLSSTQSATTLTVVPGPPTGPSAVSTSPTSLTLTWTNPSLSSGSLLNNTVYYATSCTSLSSKSSTGAAVGTYVLSGLTASTTYCLRVTAWDQQGESNRSVFFNGTTANAIPSAPTGLTYVSASRTAVTISWTNPSGSLVNDTVYWKAGAACASGAAGISASITTSYTVGSLVAGTEYCFIVSAWSTGGQSVDSAPVTGFTQGATPPSPTGLVVFTIGTSWANIGWTNPSGYTLFNDTIYWKASTCGPAWPSSHSAGAVVNSYNITGLTPSSTYCVSVTAWDNQSAYSRPLMLTTAAVAVPGGGNPGGWCGGCPTSDPFSAPQNTDDGSLAVIVASIGFIAIVAAAVLLLGGKRSRRSGRRRGR